jgi:hypothetical protein
VTGDRGMMVAMDHGLCVSFCVCGEAIKIRLDLKIVKVSWSIDRVRLAIAKTHLCGVV